MQAQADLKFLDSAQQLFILVPPYEDWPYPMKFLESDIRA
jgi:hypothetical protein